MATAHLLEDRHRPQARCRQHWYDLALEDRFSDQVAVGRGALYGVKEAPDRSRSGSPSRC
jgi:hypothetical protein